MLLSRKAGFTTLSMAQFTAVCGLSTVLAPGPKYAASANFRILSPYANMFLDKRKKIISFDKLLSEIIMHQWIYCQVLSFGIQTG